MINAVHTYIPGNIFDNKLATLDIATNSYKRQELERVSEKIDRHTESKNKRKGERIER